MGSGTGSTDAGGGGLMIGLGTNTGEGSRFVGSPMEPGWFGAGGSASSIPIHCAKAVSRPIPTPAIAVTP